MFNTADIKEKFPIFRHYPDLVFLDSAASSQRPQEVIDTVSAFYASRNANIHRGIYTLSEEATNAYESARATVARLINADSSEIIFTRNTTESINMVAYSWGRNALTPQDTILITLMEHHANILPWQTLAKEIGCSLEVVSLTDSYTLNMQEMERKLEQMPVKLVALCHVSNVLGTKNPVAEIIRMAHAHGARVLVDGAQAVPHLPVDVQRLDADFYTFSGHKMFGPTGIGVLYGKAELLEHMPPFLTGGGMIEDVNIHNASFQEAPFKFEAGTPHIAGAIGLAAAVRFMEEISLEAIEKYEERLLAYTLDKFQSLPGVSIFGPQDTDTQAGVLSFSISGVHPHDAASLYDESNIAVRAGHHCAIPLHKALNVTATVRISFSVYNDTDDIDACVQATERIIHLFS